MNDTLLDTPGRHCTTTLDREDILNRHQERLVKRSLRLGEVIIHGVNQLHDMIHFLRITLQRLKSRTLNDRAVTVETVLL